MTSFFINLMWKGSEVIDSIMLAVCSTYLRHWVQMVIDVNIGSDIKPFVFVSRLTLGKGDVKEPTRCSQSVAVWPLTIHFWVGWRLGWLSHTRRYSGLLGAVGTYAPRCMQGGGFLSANKQGPWMRCYWVHVIEELASYRNISFVPVLIYTAGQQLEGEFVCLDLG